MGVAERRWREKEQRRNTIMDAAERVGLTEPFVQVVELGDYTVTYRIAGLLSDVKTLFTAQSSLRRRVLDTLHDAGVEIASPMLVGHRGIEDGSPLIPTLDHAVLTHREEDESAAPSDLIFDKAEEAEEEARIEKAIEELRGEAKELEQSLKDAPELEKPRIQEEPEAVGVRIGALEAELDAMEEGSEE